MTTHQLPTEPLDYGREAFKVSVEIDLQGVTRRVNGTIYPFGGPALIVSYLDDKGERVTKATLLGAVIALNPIPREPVTVLTVGEIIDLGEHGEWLLFESRNPYQPYELERIEEHDCSQDIGFNAGCGDKATHMIDGEWYCDAHGDRHAYDRD